jgi:hypothetical protein
MSKLTRQQMLALKSVYDRVPLGMSYLQFRRKAYGGFGMDCLLVQWQGMTLGIETDGYTHS